ncbi:MAG TPA: polyribonucleotide nucleotidyltransferase, partial [Patescibacteria group bacterium]
MTNLQKFSYDIVFGDQKITLSTGTLAPQTNASVLAQWGGTMVLATVIMGKADEEKDYFPLSVEFVDKLYAGGMIKGGKWIKREGGPSDAAIIFGRILDRSLRPLFPEGFMNEVQIIATVLSNDKDHDVVIPAFLAAAAALSISDVPFTGPVSIARIGLINGELVVNPTISQLANSQMDLLACTDINGINMIEADANIIDNDTMLKALNLANTTGNNINKQIADIVKEIGKPKAAYTPILPSAELLAEVEKNLQPELEKFINDGVDGGHMAAEGVILEKIEGDYADKIEKEEIKKPLLFAAVESVIRKYVRQSTLKGRRYDKRALDEIRPLDIKAGVLASTHGSALFQRGLTQAITVTTLGPLSEKQFLQDSLGETTKRYIHYYSAMPFSTGQSGKVG